MPSGPTSPANTGLGRGANLPYSDGMRLTSRDDSLLQSLDRFGQLDSGHIWDLHFSDCKSKTSWDQVAKRLMKGKYIVRMGRRMVLGDGAGSGKAVYQLGATGWQWLNKRGVYRARFTSVSEHRLKVADAFSELCKREDMGEIKIRGYYTEPDSHMQLAGVTVRPDLFVDLELVATSEQLRLWIEIDRDKENRPQIERKLRDYVSVYRGVTKAEMDPVPAVLFLADTEIGLTNLKNYMHGNLGEFEELITVDHIDGFAERLK